MSKLREAAQAALEHWDKVSGIFRMTTETEALRSALAQPPAAPDAEVRTQHKEFARWFLELGDKSALASEYLAWLAWKAALAHPPRDEWREAAEEALRWMEHARLHLTIKERMHPDGLSLYDSAAEALRAALAQPEPEAPRDEWRPASEPPEDGRR